MQWNNVLFLPGTATYIVLWHNFLWHNFYRPNEYWIAICNIEQNKWPFVTCKCVTVTSKSCIQQEQQNHEGYALYTVLLEEAKPSFCVQNFPPVLKIELWSRIRLATLTFYAACTVCVTILSTGGKFRSSWCNFYVVTRSYSSRPFLCALADTNSILSTSVWSLAYIHILSRC